MSHIVASSRRFYGTTNKPKSTWFWDPNQEIIAVILRLKSSNRSCRFCGPNREILHHLGFEAQPKNRRHRFWGQTGETVSVVLRPNHWQTVELGFEAQPRNPRSSSPRAWCRPHTAPPDLSIARPPSTRPLDRSATEYPTCATIPSPLHQVSYSYHNPRCCTPCRTCHLHTTRQANMILQLNKG
jgi:hypothetical protein